MNHLFIMILWILIILNFNELLNIQNNQKGLKKAPVLTNDPENINEGQLVIKKISDFEIDGKGSAPIWS